MKPKSTVLLVATMDTKGEEVLYLSHCLEEAGVQVLLMDVGILGDSPIPVQISARDVAKTAGSSIEQIRVVKNEGKAIEIMIKGAIQRALSLYEEGKIQGILSLGGSMGTDMGTSIMRTFPIGFPKVMISTLASHNTRPFVGTRDIMMLNAVCDLSGLNLITERVLKNGAWAVAGMAKAYARYEKPSKPLIIISTLGTTEICSLGIKRFLEGQGREVVVFHTTGTGGKALEEMVREEVVEAVIDISLTELGNNLIGGEFDAGPTRGQTSLEKGVPIIFVPGNTDFFSTGPLNFAKQRFPGRKYHIHNAAITAIRIEHSETVLIAKRLAKLCNAGKGLRAIIIPLGGLSSFDQPDGPFYDPEAPALFLESLKKYLHQGTELHVFPYHVNNPAFIEEVIRIWQRFCSPKAIN
jgi:uncharacterized protein (UPF0261 family)